MICKESYFDMTSSIQGMDEDPKLIFDTRHIKGHQDDVKEEDLDRLACLMLNMTIGKNDT